MPFESPRIAELRRRVRADPASIAFAQLGEEYRRAGDHEAAVQVCRAGLARHPSYLSARVTLGRALIELGAIDEAQTELDTVLRAAPDNLAAIRGRAEIHQRRGELEPALDFYRRALDLANSDPALERTVRQIGQEIERDGAAGSMDSEPPGAEAGAGAGFDFDELHAALGGDAAAGAQGFDRPRGGRMPPRTADLDMEGLADAADAGDALAGLELQLRANETRPAMPPDGPLDAGNGDSLDPALHGDRDQLPTAQAGGDEEVLRQLDGWLSAIRAERRR